MLLPKAMGALMMVNRDGEGGSFLGRWSQRKVKARHDSLPATEPIKPAELAKPVAEVAQAPVGQPSAATGTGSQSEAPSKPPPPTLDDVAKLTADSDYSGFAARHVDASVRNAAMRKLFAGDPHFNVMDGLDVYIDDYSVGVPIPKAMMRQMVQARSLGLLDDELVDQDQPRPPEIPTDIAANDNTIHHENTDLQLQPDNTAGHSSVADRAEPPEKRLADQKLGVDTKPDTDTFDQRPV